MMKINFCTLFDINYFSRGLALYESLRKNIPLFHLYIFTFDEITFNYLEKLNLAQVTLIPKNVLEDDDLFKVKPSRSVAEYCWTCTPSTLLYVLNNFKVDSCTYVDADLYFYDNPQILLDEIKGASVMITPHFFSPEYSSMIKYGKYCVQFITFKNNEQGLKILHWWREACLQWCYARLEDGKYGDQKYLDGWTTMFEGVHELQHPGVAPWNAQQYLFSLDGLKMKFKKKDEAIAHALVFYHFHDLSIMIKKYTVRGLSLLKNKKLNYGTYRLSDDIVQLIYLPYLQELKTISAQFNLSAIQKNIYGLTIKNRERKLENLFRKR